MNELGRFDTLSDCSLQNGKFKFEGIKKKYGEFHFLALEGNIRDKNLVKLLVDSDSIIISGNITSWPNLMFSGDSENVKFNNFLKADTDFLTAVDSLTKSFENIRKIFENDADKKRFEHRMKYIKEFPNSSYTPFLIMTTPVFSSNDKLREFNLLSEKAKNSFYGVELKKNIELTKNAEKIAVENQLPECTFPTPNGNLLNLKEAVSKSALTLIEFWASWCGPCRSETPNLRNIYNTYKKQGFNILSVSLDVNRGEWVEAIEKDEMKWLHVSDLKGWKSDAATVFRITHVPQGYIVDKSGKILASDLQGAKLLEFVENFFSNAKD